MINIDLTETLMELEQQIEEAVAQLAFLRGKRAGILLVVEQSNERRRSEPPTPEG